MILRAGIWNEDFWVLIVLAQYLNHPLISVSTSVKWGCWPHHTPLSVSSSGSSTKAVSDLSIVKRKVCVRWSLSGVELCPLLKDTLESYLPEPVTVTVFRNRVFADGITEVKMRSDWTACVCAKSL